eukprot:CAMPEP_0115177618 /NCGR_PEP_ID=MMETSP0270-20121206/5473_1 /TAXON_ID=71861 /ORGANISM="Scrippsiella trochoidea, Strain CCMP3099" /LENGTH=113 /DNA_ID=CAMNT_0002590545 /DNA_START=99 /DNA_END=437 /DNA_ORIENTATION=+
MEATAALLALHGGDRDRDRELSEGFLSDEDGDNIRKGAKSSSGLNKSDSTLGSLQYSTITSDGSALESFAAPGGAGAANCALEEQRSPRPTSRVRPFAQQVKFSDLRMQAMAY